MRWNDFVSTSEPYPLYNAFRGTLPFEVNFTAQGYPCQKCLRGRLGDLVKFTFSRDPRQKAFWGTLSFEVNFTGRDYPLQKQPYVGREGEDDFIVIKRAAS